MKRKFVDMLNIGMHLPNNKHLQKLYNRLFLLLNIFFGLTHSATFIFIIFVCLCNCN